MIFLLSLFISLAQAYSINVDNLKCQTIDSSAYNGVIARLRVEDRTGNLAEQYKQKCKPIVKRIQEAPAKSGPSDEQCLSCKNRMISQSKTGYPRFAIKGNCQDVLGCSSSQLGGLLGIFATDSVISSCGTDLFCSKESQFCEYICPESFKYNIVSGLCEKNCTNQEIFVNGECRLCPEDSLPNSEKNSCICSNGEIPVNGSCETIDSCDPNRFPTMTISWYYNTNQDLNSIVRARTRLTFDYKDYNCNQMIGPSGFNGSPQYRFESIEGQGLPNNIHFLYPDIRSFTPNQWINKDFWEGFDLNNYGMSVGIYCTHKVTGVSLSVCANGYEGVYYLNNSNQIIESFPSQKTPLDDF